MFRNPYATLDTMITKFAFVRCKANISETSTEDQNQ